MQFQCSAGLIDVFRLTLDQDIPSSELVDPKENQLVAFIVERGASGDHKLALPANAGTVSSPDIETPVLVVMFLFNRGRLWPVSPEAMVTK